MTVTVAGLKAHLNIEHDEDDALLVGKIASASAWIVSYCGLLQLPDELPANLVEAFYQLAGHLYAHRGDEADLVPIPAIVKSLVAPNYVWAV